MPSYTNSEQRDINQKLGEFPSVLDFADWQTAIDAVVADGRNGVFIPPGAYTLSTSLTVPNGFTLMSLGSPDRWRGGKPFAKITYTGATAAVTVQPSAGAGLSSISLIGIEFDGAGSAANTDGILLDASAAGVTYIENLLIDRCTFRNFRRAIHSKGTVFDVTLRRVTAIDCSGDLIYVDAASSGAGQPSQWTFDDCWLVPTTTDTWAFREVNGSLAGLMFNGGTIADGSAGGACGINAVGHLIVLGTRMEGLVTYADVTADAGTDAFTATANPFANDTKVRVSASSSLPGGVASGTDYYVVNRTGTTFQIATSVGGAAVNITSVGSGVRVYNRPGSVAIRYQGSLGLFYSGKAINWGVGIQVGDPTSKAGNATAAQIFPFAANNGWDVQLVDGGSRGGTKIHQIAGAGTGFVENLRASVDGDVYDLQRFDGNWNAGGYDILTDAMMRCLQIGVNCTPNYYLDVNGAFTGVESGIYAGFGGKVLIGKSGAEAGKLIILSSGGRKLELLSDTATGTLISNSFGPLQLDPATKVDILNDKPICLGSADGDQPIHVKKSSTPKVLLEEPIDGTGAAFAGIASTRDGSSGYKGKLVFYANNGGGLTDPSAVVGWIDSDGYLTLGNNQMRLVYYSASPDGVLGGLTGSLCLSQNGTLWQKTAADATSWVQIGGGDLVGETLLLDDPAAFIQLKKSGVLKFHVTADGNIVTLGSIQVPVLVKSDSGYYELQTAAGVTKFKADASGDVTAAGNLTLSGATASRPAKLNSSKVLVGDKIDLSSTNEVTTGSATDGQVAAWNSGRLIGLNIGTGSSDVAAGNHNHAGQYAAAIAVGGNSVTLAKLTPGGSNGSLTWNDDGQITSYTPPS